MRLFKNGAPASEGAILDLREGSGISLTIADEPNNAAASVTIANSGSITATGTNDIVFTTGSPGVERARIAHDGTITGLAAAANVPTLSELVSTIMVQTGISVTTSLGLFVAPFACKVTALSLTFSEAHAASDTDYWTAQLKKEPADVIIAAKTTQITGGVAIVQWTDWNFDAVAFDATNQLLAKGDSVRLRLAPTGAPAALTGTLATIRYEPT